jgi:hypothetical protein
METQWATAPNLMSVSGSGSWVNDSGGNKLIFSRAFLGGVLQKMGVFRGIWMDKTWCVAGKNVVN